MCVHCVWLEGVVEGEDGCAVRHCAAPALRHTHRPTLPNPPAPAPPRPARPLQGETEAIGKLLERTMLQRYGPAELGDHFMIMDTICDATQARRRCCCDCCCCCCCCCCRYEPAPAFAAHAMHCSAFLQ